MLKKRKFNLDQVSEIRRSKETSQKLADLLGVSASCICKIRNGWVYKEIRHGSKAVLGLST
jgi:predicted transcriptional regulator